MNIGQLSIRKVVYKNSSHPWYGKTAYQIMLNTSGTRYANPRIYGCPLGRGLTVDEAYNDLRRRIMAESNVDIGLLEKGDMQCTTS